MIREMKNGTKVEVFIIGPLSVSIEEGYVWEGDIFINWSVGQMGEIYSEAGGGQWDLVPLKEDPNERYRETWL